MFPPIITFYGLVQNGELVHMLERHHIEGRPAEMILRTYKMLTSTVNPAGKIQNHVWRGFFIWAVSNPNCHSNEEELKQLLIHIYPSEDKV
jgi:hypothetical protein